MVLRKLFIGSLAALSAVCTLSLTAFAAETLTSEQVIEKMQAKMMDLKSLAYSGDVKAEITSVDYSSTKWNQITTSPSTRKMKTEYFNVGFSGATDIKNPLDPKGLFKLNVKTNAFTGKSTSFGLEYRFLGNVGYAKLNKAVDLGFFDLSSLKNKWVKFDFKAFEDQLGFGDDMVSGPDDRKMTEEQVEKLKAAFEKYDILKITAELPEVMIDRVKTYHYKFAFNKDEVKKFLIEAEQIEKGRALNQNELMMIESDFAGVTMPTGEIWIGKTDFLPRKIVVDLNITEPNSLESAKINFTLLFKNFDKAVKVVAPSKSQSIDELMESVFGGF
ncbi:MAG TPA: hypothetical protein VEC13_00600 [Candidatus Paceibacterota bacterium]|nr:hypothetical protein [Candidatus Paceibacterota bacterium]